MTNGLAKLRDLIGGVAGASRGLSLASEQTSSAANQASVPVEQIARASGEAGGGNDAVTETQQAMRSLRTMSRTPRAR